VKPYTVFPRTLVAEDDPLDAFLLSRAFQKAGVKEAVHFVGGGREAIDYLRGKQLSLTSASSTLPAVLLLNLKMPGVSGFAVLQWIGLHPHLRPDSIVVLGASPASAEASRAITLGADHYLVKPCDEEGMDEVPQRILALLEHPRYEGRVKLKDTFLGQVVGPAL
jgi:two-component system response regulator